MIFVKCLARSVTVTSLGMNLMNPRGAYLAAYLQLKLPIFLIST